MKTYILYNPLAGYGGSEEKARALGETLSGEVECRDVTAIADHQHLARIGDLQLLHGIGDDLGLFVARTVKLGS